MSDDATPTPKDSMESSIPAEGTEARAAPRKKRVPAAAGGAQAASPAADPAHAPAHDSAQEAPTTLEKAPENVIERIRTAMATARAHFSLAHARRIVLALALAVSVLSAGYWLLIASDRYVSEAHVLVQKTGLPGATPTDFGSLLTGNSVNHADQMVLRDHLLSVDMLRKLDEQLHLRKHYSDWHIDPLSRLWFEDTSIEKYHEYFLKRVRIDYDDYSGLLVIRAQAFDPKTAQAIVSMMIAEGEKFMNDNDHALARAQVDFLEGETARMSQRNMAARSAVLAFQNKEGIVSPEATVQAISGIITQLEARKSALETQLRSLESYLVPDHPSVVSTRQEIAAIDQQISDERKRLAANTGTALNSTAEKFQRLQMEAAFTQQLYQSTLAALEKGRIDAMRTVKKVSIMQSATLPEYSTEPRRVHNAVMVAAISFLLAGIAILLIAIVRDHID